MQPALFAVPDPPDDLDAGGALPSSVVGRVAELRAEVRLLELGFAVWRPSVDEGVDLLVGPGVRVQVKSSAGLTASRGQWEFEFRHGKKHGRRAGGNRARLRAQTADVFLFYARDADIWWVVPASELPHGMGRVRITPGGLYDGWREAWDVFGRLAA